MSKRTARANAQAIPNVDHPDAAIFALAEQCAAAAKVAAAASEVLGRAEERCRHLTTPPVAIRTEKDRQLGLFVGNRVGKAYGQEDVPLLRALVRTHSVITDERDVEVWKRACDIIAALKDIKEEEAREGDISGLTIANKAWCEATDAWEDLAERLARIPAKTIEGAFAKARSMRRSFLEEGDDFGDIFEDSLRRTLCRQGPDDGACALSLARDLIALAEKEEAR